MAGGTKARFAIGFLMILTLALPLASPAENVSETAYDESEALPYEGASPFSVVVPPVAARTTHEVQNSLYLKLGAPSLFAPARIHDTDANRSAEAECRVVPMRLVHQRL